VISVAFSPDGSILASGSWDNSIKLWDPIRGQELKTFTGHTGGVNSIVFSPDGKLLVSGGFDRTVIVWDVATAKILHTL
jgi:WD40 repeat protein